MNKQITMLVDERVDLSPYVVCFRTNKGTNLILDSGKVSSALELLKLQKLFNAYHVHIDFGIEDSEIKKVSTRCKWKLMKFNEMSFSYIEAMTSLGIDKSKLEIIAGLNGVNLILKFGLPLSTKLVGNNIVFNYKNKPLIVLKAYA